MPCPDGFLRRGGGSRIPRSCIVPGGVAVSATGGGARRPADGETGRFGVAEPAVPEGVEGPPEGGAPVPGLTPGGGVVVRTAEDEIGLELAGGAAAAITAAFAESRAAGILHLGAAHPRTDLHPTLDWWRDFGTNFAAAAGAALDPRAPEAPAEPEPGRVRLYEHAFAAPPLVGRRRSRRRCCGSRGRNSSKPRRNAAGPRRAARGSGCGSRTSTGTPSAGCGGTWPRTGAPRSAPSPSSPPMWTGRPGRPSRCIGRSARRRPCSPVGAQRKFVEPAGAAPPGVRRERTPAAVDRFP